MSRLSLAACVLALLPAVSLAQGPRQGVSPGEAKPARFDVKPANFVAPSPPPPWTGMVADVPPGYTYYGQRLQWQLWWDEHNCAPDGCPKPIGCGNHWTEKKFIFGSCRQFFGTAESTVGHGYGTAIRQR
jgi:hypothetical protein